MWVERAVRAGGKPGRGRCYLELMPKLLAARLERLLSRLITGIHLLHHRIVEFSLTHLHHYPKLLSLGGELPAQGGGFHLPPFCLALPPQLQVGEVILLLLPELPPIGLVLVRQHNLTDRKLLVVLLLHRVMYERQGCRQWGLLLEPGELVRQLPGLGHRLVRHVHRLGEPPLDPL